jgi:hypothetical protein
MKVADVVLDWEDSSLPTSPPTWVRKYPVRRFANFINGYKGDVNPALNAVRSDHAWYAYVADSDNYVTLPKYWKAEQRDACP